jgi:hypothetical protein
MLSHAKINTRTGLAAPKLPNGIAESVISLKFPVREPICPCMSTDPSRASKTCTVLMPSDPAGVRREIPALFESFSARRLTICAPEALAVSSVISVRCGDAMFLGEVTACATHGDSRWLIQVRVEQILSGLEGLMALRARLLDEPVPQSVRMLP